MAPAPDPPPGAARLKSRPFTARAPAADPDTLHGAFIILVRGTPAAAPAAPVLKLHLFVTRVMPVSDQRLRTLSAVHLIAATAILFSFGEQIVQALAVRKAFLSSELFYLPALSVSVAAICTVQLALLLCFLLLHRVRPVFHPVAALAAAAPPLLGYAGLYDFSELFRQDVSALYGRPIPGRMLSFLFVFLTLLVLLTGLSRLRLRAPAETAAAAAKPAAARRLAPLLVAFVAAGLAHGPAYETYASLFLVILWLLALPLAAGGLAYRFASRSSDAVLASRTRGYFAVALLVGFASLVLQYGPEGGSARAVPAGVALGLLGAGAVLALRPAWRQSLLLPPLTASLLLVLPLLELAWLRRPGPPPEPGQIVFLFTVDTLRRDAISFYNPATAPTPNLDALHQDSVVFTRAWSSASWTLPALASITTGVPPRVHQVESVRKKLPQGLETLAEQFQAQGYATEALVFNPLLSLGRGFDQGFERYDALPIFFPVTTLGHKLALRIWGDRFDPSASVDGMARLAARRILRHRGDRLFLWLHVFDPHDPYEPPARHWPADVARGRVYPAARQIVKDPEIRREMRALYLAEVLYLDEAVGTMLGALRHAGIYDNLTVVFTADHGEEFWERDRWGHGNEPTDTQARVSLAMKLPGGGPGREVDAAVSTSEVMPLLHGAVADAARGHTGGDAPSAWEAYLAGRAESGEALGLYIGSVRLPHSSPQGLVFGAPPYKYLVDEKAGTEALYDLAADPGETVDLAAARPEVLEQGREIFLRVVDEAEARAASIEQESDVEMSPEVLDELRHLGYIQ